LGTRNDKEQLHDEPDVGDATQVLCRKERKSKPVLRYQVYTYWVTVIIGTIPITF
jgi:hypothetical protein